MISAMLQAREATAILLVRHRIERSRR